MRKITLNLLIFFSMLIATNSIYAVSKAPKKVLIFSLTKGFRHKSIEKGIEAIKKLASENNFEVTATEDAFFFNDSTLSTYKAVIFLSPTGNNLFNDIQKAAFQKFIRNGGGFVGIHAATDCNYEWEWYGKMVGGYFTSHPKIQEAKINVLDHKHLSTKHLPEIWMHTDEWYNFKNFNKNVKVLMTVDEKSYQGGKMPDFHPIAWHHKFDGGKIFYTALGHTNEDFEDPLFLNHLKGGILYALK